MMSAPDPATGTTTIVDGDLTTPVRQLRSNGVARNAAVALGRMHPLAAERYANRDHGHHENRMSKWKARRFVAWDGEGVTVDGRHRYVILASSAGDTIVNPDEVGTIEAFDLFLAAGVRDKYAVHVIFAGSYDVNMILSPVLERHQAKILANEGRVTLRLDGRRFRIIYHPRHTFEVLEEEYDPVSRRVKVLRKFCLWDVFGSFQSSFVKACERTLPPEDLADLAQITTMKAKRGEFTLHDLPEMLDYCRAELRALVRLSELDAGNFEVAGFAQTRYDGAGAKASAVLRMNKVGSHMSPTGQDMIVPSRAAYAGGRIECYRFGDYVGPLFTIDLRSAYPWAATMLPSLHAGQWVRATDGPGNPDEFSVWHVRYTGERADTIHPLFWRGPRGNICYPQVTEGWYWAPEVWQALRHRPGQVEIVDGWRFVPAVSELRPFEFVPRLFHARRVLEGQMKGRGWPLKLALNSLYGKLAQQIGGREGKAPRWHQLEWAGWITSKVRSEMFNIAATRTAQLISIETDGLTLTGTPDAELLARVGTELGDLEVAQYSAGTFVQSGIYWLKDGDGWHDPKVRGVGSGVLNREVFREAWEGSAYGSVPVVVTRFRGLVTSSLTPERWQEWCQWVPETRQLAVCPEGKRIHVTHDCPACQGGGGGLHSTLPIGGGTKSALHSLSWETTLGRDTADEWWLDTLEEEDE